MTDVKYRCLVCDKDDQWENVDQYRHKPEGMSICKSCGFVTYPEKLSKSDETLKEFYRNDYRKPPTVANQYTGERKLHYHAAFLEPLFKKWKANKLDKPVITEIGAAFGMFLNFCKQTFPGADVNGTELTKSFRANAWEEYGINLTEEIDESKKYDMIATYKVAEHIPNSDKELRKYAELLNKDGVVYVSVPLWFKYMTNFGVGGFDIEYYYHTNHINTWTQEHFEYLLKKAGLEVIGTNHCFYDSTYLCRRNDDLMKEPIPEFKSYEKIKEIMDHIKKAAIAYEEKNFQGAIELYGQFPMAWAALYESNRAQYHQLGFDKIKTEFIDKAIELMPDDVNIFLLGIDICMRYGKYDGAIELINHVMKMSPNNVSALKSMMHTFIQLADGHVKNGEFLEAAKYFTQARDTARFVCNISTQARQEFVTWALNMNARIWEMQEKAKAWDGKDFFKLKTEGVKNG